MLTEIRLIELSEIQELFFRFKMWNKCLDWSRIWEYQWLSLRHIYNKFAIGIQSETVMLYDAELQLYLVWCWASVIWWSAEQFVNFNSEQHSETVVFHRIILVNQILNLHTFILTLKRSFASSRVDSFVCLYQTIGIHIVLYSRVSHTSMSDV